MQDILNGKAKRYEAVELRHSPRLACAESEEKWHSMRVSEGIQATSASFRGLRDSGSYHGHLQSMFNDKRQTCMHGEGWKPRRLVSGISSAFVSWDAEKMAGESESRIHHQSGIPSRRYLCDESETRDSRPNR